MKGVRAYATATLLPDGKVLVAGGASVIVVGALGQQEASAELYDPSTRQFTPTGSMKFARSNAAAALLRNGKVLILGGEGCEGSPLCNSGSHRTIHLRSAELYDPATGTFTSTGSMSQPCDNATATLLPDGRVLALSAWGRAVEAYDPATGKFARVGTLSNEYTNTSLFASLLPDGRVLVVGTGSSRLEAEVFDPGTRVSEPIPFSVSAPASDSYVVESATSLRDGRVLVQVRDTSSTYPQVHMDMIYLSMFEPSTETFADVGTIDLPQWSAAGAVLLRDGRVLFLGDAQDPNGGEILEPAAGIYDPVSGFHVIDARVTQDRLGQTMTLLPDGTVLLAGGDGIPEALSSAELFVP